MDGFTSKAVGAFYADLDRLAQAQPLLFSAGDIEMLESDASSREAGVVRVGTLWAYCERSGWGTALLGLIVALADRHRVAVDLTPTPLNAGVGAIGVPQLVAFYRRFGFEPSGERMVRAPRPSAEGAALLDRAFAGEELWRMPAAPRP